MDSNRVVSDTLQDMVTTVHTSHTSQTSHELAEQLNHQQQLTTQLSERLRAHENQGESLHHLKQQVQRLEDESMTLLHSVPDLQHRIVDSEKKILRLEQEKVDHQHRLEKACSAHWCPYTNLWRPYVQPYGKWYSLGVMCVGLGYWIWKRK